MAKEQKNGTTATAGQEEQPKAKARARTPKPLGPCACGCDDKTRSTWCPGHDAKLWGVAHRYQSGRLDNAEAKKLLEAFPQETVKANKARLLEVAPELPIS